MRSMFQGAVGGLEPAEDALERLRIAVPRRRARKRQALVGAAAMVVLAGVGVPTLMHLTGSPDQARDTAAVAGHGQDSSGQTAGTAGDPNLARPGLGKSKSPKPADKGKGGRDAEDEEAGEDKPDRGKGRPEAPEPGSAPTGGASGSAGASAGDAPTGKAKGKRPKPPAAGASAPACSAGQLGAVADTRTPDADGKVYGTFRVTNLSGQGCVVSAAGSLTVAPAPGSPGQPLVPVVEHTEDDPATGLPPASAAAASLMLTPNTAYEVQFAWVPATEGCPAVPPTNGPSDQSGAQAPAETPTGATGGADGVTDSDPLDGGATPGSTGLEVTHTAEPGAPVAQTSIPSACGSGTVYTTGVIPVDSAQ
ncbi:hypothetical protein DEJ50_17660 [Streptomyces venezuelae]|uniref:DUF4232 domain-containing protein n=1 Tax=Streptomyces venezuelae TaxID=54571 RepID=A0A5P2DE37_STRVZ|nr:hypothetical protein DEJ50_17660 [Streptomyces venezuelae]